MKRPPAVPPLLLAECPDPGPRPPRRRRLGRSTTLVVVAVTALALLAGGCSSSTSSNETTSGTSGSSGGSNGEPGDRSVPNGTFPVTIGHKYGETTIEQRPERVVTVGLTDHDAVLALGTVPVGVTDWLKAHPSAIGPWATDALGDGAAPEVISDATVIDFESIAALEPDVILGLYSGLTETEYDTLSQIAPTVAQPGDVVDYGISWQDQTRTVGEVLGEQSTADELVYGVEAQFDEVKAANPDFEGAEGLVATIWNEKISIYGPEDSRGRFMDALGFTQSDEIAELAEGTFSADVSMERVDLVDVDVLVWIVLDVEADRVKFAEEPIYSGLAVHTGGHDVYVANGSDVGSALSFQSVLSVPFLIDELEPQLAAARAGTGAAVGTTSTTGG
jgi:iron complex transport system substrate-binding protein